jgi:peroxiredoxin
MDKYKVLSIPAVYVIRANGEIAFAYSEPDYRVRLPAEEVKAAVARVLSESK